LDRTGLAIGAIIGTGIFVIVGEAMRFAAWLLLGLVIYGVDGSRSSRVRRPAV
jgi:amino acid permease